ncbi:hypothetical protein [Microbacterium sp. Ag1]|uniref:hypothetical protein n=1 Tax=Microbacterium sp. Ag1 TaxID=1643443 RepID=UPI00062906C9|nr:hypothetical protein [Microbacterium sp. Ag1]KKX99682.1 hypothetical protein AAY78_00550 [Microbacterium sp. Ag1]
MQITARDERIFEWLRVVKLADTEAVRWVLAALDGRDEPVSTRRAQQWIARAVEAELVEKARPVFRDGTVIWLSRLLSNRAAPNLYRATTRHEVAVSSISSRFLAAGYSWRRDRQPATKQEHAADGVAERAASVELVEVELTAKTLHRYRGIFTDHTRRLTEGVERVVYIGTAGAMRAVDREANKWVHPSLRDRIVTLEALDERGHIVAPLDALWPGDAPPAPAPAPAPAEPAPELEAAPAAPELPMWGGRD